MKDKQFILPPLFRRTSGAIAGILVFAATVIPVSLITNEYSSTVNLVVPFITFTIGYIVGLIIMSLVKKSDSFALNFTTCMGTLLAPLIGLCISLGVKIPFNITVLVWGVSGLFSARAVNYWFTSLASSKGARSFRLLTGSAITLFLGLAIVIALKPPVFQSIVIIVAGIFAFALSQTLKNNSYGEFTPEIKTIRMFLHPLTAAALLVHGFSYGLVMTHLPHFPIRGMTLVLFGGIVGFMIFFFKVYRQPDKSIDLVKELISVLIPLTVAMIGIPHLINWGEYALTALAAGAFAYFTFATIYWFLRIAKRAIRLAIALMNYLQIILWAGMLTGLLFGYFIGNPYCTAGVCIMASTVIVSVLVITTILGTRNHSLDEKELGSRSIKAGIDETPKDEKEKSLIPNPEELLERLDLSPRETEVFQLFVELRNVDEVSERLYISSSTTRTHLFRIYSKLGLSSVQELKDFLDGKIVSSDNLIQDQ